VLDKEMPYSSYFSMGLDIADINNDGWPTSTRPTCSPKTTAA